MLRLIPVLLLAACAGDDPVLGTEDTASALGDTQADEASYRYSFSIDDS